MKLVKLASSFLSILLLTSTIPAFAVSMPINLFDNFYFDPTVTFSPDGFEATLAEGDSPVILANDPGEGDPEVIEPDDTLRYLSFNYEFFEGSSDDEKFRAFIIDPDTGDILDPAFDFSTEDSGSDMVAFDLIQFAGQLLGLQFEMESLPGDAGGDSTVRVFNVALRSSLEETLPVPEPATILFLSTGLLGLIGWRKMRSKKA